MRENRLSGSEGGGAETNQSFLPLFASRAFGAGDGWLYCVIRAPKVRNVTAQANGLGMWVRERASPNGAE